MRVKAAFIVLVVFGGVLTANQIIDVRTLKPAELENIRTVCPACHGLVPVYDHPSKVHNKHAAFECSRCHNYDSGMEPVDNLHNGLKWLGIGTMAFGLAGIITNIIIVNRKGRLN